MSSSTLYVRFPNGEFRFGICYNTTEVVIPPLFDSSVQASDWYDVWHEADSKPWPQNPEPSGTVYDVVMTEGIHTWSGRATRHFVLEPEGVFTDRYESDPDWSWDPPDWYDEAQAAELKALAELSP